MLDSNKQRILADRAMEEELGKVPEVGLESMDELQLRVLRDQIDELLPVSRLEDMNLTEALVAQFMKVRLLQQEVLLDNRVPANQKAQVSSAVASTLQTLIKLQSDLHTAERFKKIEGLMLKAIKKMPPDVASEFLDEYEDLVGEAE